MCCPDCSEFASLDAGVEHDYGRVEMLTSSQQRTPILDAYVLRASEVLGILPENVSPEQRAAAKAAMLGELYGMKFASEVARAERPRQGID